MTNSNAKNILICDDDDLLREFYSRVLKSQGYKTLSATNGDEGIDVLENSGVEISLAIVDLLMPIRTGWELIEYMKNSDKLKDIPIVAVSGLATSFDEFEKVKDACHAVLHKGDFDLESFTKIVNDLVK